MKVESYSTINNFNKRRETFFKIFVSLDRICVDILWNIKYPERSVLFLRYSRFGIEHAENRVAKKLEKYSFHEIYEVLRIIRLHLQNIFKYFNLLYSCK